MIFIKTLDIHNRHISVFRYYQCFTFIIYGQYKNVGIIYICLII